MQVLFVSNTPPPPSLQARGNSTLQWVQQSPDAGALAAADLVIDWTVEEQPHRIDVYRQTATPVILGLVLFTLHELELTQVPIARMNHWPGFGERNLIELAFPHAHASLPLERLQALHLPFTLVPDVVGFVSTRIVAGIINEACFAWGEGVSTPAEIDTAMRLGTNYPKGPFEWLDAIGAGRVHTLLQRLALTDLRYAPAPQLQQLAQHGTTA
ncbi:MAG: 3-hydroxyacyl-CoA dehydrogenase family protein [Lacibacter sp.]